MKSRIFLTFCLGACLISMACPSRPSASGPDEAAELELKVNLINGLMSQRGLAARILNDLSTALPGRVWLTEVTYDSEGIRVKGNALSNNLLADYVSRLAGSPNLTEVNLLSSVQKRVRNSDYEEFMLRALIRDTRTEKPPESGSRPDSAAVAELTRRLEELEKFMPARKETADILRQFQQVANDSGLKITKFAPGGEIPGEFTSAWPISIDVTGTRQNLGRFFDMMIDVPGLWLIKKFSFNAISNQDATSPIRASLTAQTYFLRETPADRTRR